MKHPTATSRSANGKASTNSIRGSPPDQESPLVLSSKLKHFLSHSDVVPLNSLNLQVTKNTNNRKAGSN
ncbi:hypothetical protein [Anabaena sp. CCY 9402-a]|uniref:hypothetical protein n=1 Tax=Anabaena sp. CCY 9402-a TaxID=3103867 RepID=UPI0039C619B6